MSEPQRYGPGAGPVYKPVETVAFEQAISVFVSFAREKLGLNDEQIRTLILEKVLTEQIRTPRGVSTDHTCPTCGHGDSDFCGGRTE